MSTALTVLIVLAIGATLVVLLMGVFNLMKKGHDPVKSNKLMRWRVILQAAAVALIFIVLWLTKH
jgi:uncharacterized membrane protein YozB (DUF420 family)